MDLRPLVLTLLAAGCAAPLPATTLEVQATSAHDDLPVAECLLLSDQMEVLGQTGDDGGLELQVPRGSRVLLRCPTDGAVHGFELPDAPVVRWHWQVAGPWPPRGDTCEVDVLADLGHLGAVPGTDSLQIGLQGPSVGGWTGFSAPPGPSHNPVARLRQMVPGGEFVAWTSLTGGRRAAWAVSDPRVCEADGETHEIDLVPEPIATELVLGSWQGDPAFDQRLSVGPMPDAWGHVPPASLAHRVWPEPHGFLARIVTGSFEPPYRALGCQTLPTRPSSGLFGDHDHPGWARACGEEREVAPGEEWDLGPLPTPGRLTVEWHPGGLAFRAPEGLEEAFLEVSLFLDGELVATHAGASGSLLLPWPALRDRLGGRLPHFSSGRWSFDGDAGPRPEDWADPGSSTPRGPRHGWTGDAGVVLRHD